MSLKLMTYRDLSERWQKPVSTLRALVMKKKLRPIKLGRDVRFSMTYIEEIEAKGGF
jgi:hypothetical protein